MATTFDQKANFVRGDVSTGYDASATSIDLASGQGTRFPDPASGAYNLVWKKKNVNEDANIEVIRVTGKSTDTLTITRAQEGTSAATHNDVGAEYEVYLAPTKKIYTDIETAVNAIENSTAIVLTAVKTTDETVNNSTTLQDDDHMQISVKANTTYIFELSVIGTQGGNASLKISMVTATNTPTINCRTLYNATDRSTLETYKSSTTTLLAAGDAWKITNTFGCFFEAKGTVLIGANDTTLKVQWAQGTATIADTKFLKGSYIKLTKVS
jgi:hypothetical protein